MKDYPHIHRGTGQNFQEIPNAYVFDKLDGSNLRAEGSRKKGWYKFGSRTQLIDHTHPFLGSFLPLFKAEFEDKLSKMMTDERWDSATVYGEFLGDHSFAGWHDPNDLKRYFIFDIAPYKKGILGPKEFLRLAETYQFAHPAFLGNFNWTRGFVEQVWRGEVPCTFEGVVGKGGDGHKLVMAKAKTQAWIAKVKATHTAVEAEKIINS